MDRDQTQTDTRWSLRDIIVAGPTRTILAAGFLGLMWGPILVSVVDAVERVGARQEAQTIIDERGDQLPTAQHQAPAAVEIEAQVLRSPPDTTAT
jgi:hypothetical protein